jgi:Tfp pilus assembly protein PilE
MGLAQAVLAVQNARQEKFFTQTGGASASARDKPLKRFGKLAAGTARARRVELSTHMSEMIR